MGPEATLEFFRRVLEQTSAPDDQSHVHLLIDNNPRVPDRNLAVAGKGPSPAPTLTDMARRLERAGADYLVMVCNAAHAFRDAIEQAVSIPFISIIEETRDEVLRQFPEARRVALLASTGCVDSGLYQDAFAPHGLDVMVPEGHGRAEFMRLLYRIKSGDKSPDVSAAMAEIASGLRGRGAEVLVAGCTEVPLVLTAADVALPLVDSLAVLVASTIRLASP